MFELQTSTHTMIVVKPSTFKGQEGVDIRKWYRKGDGPWLPTQKGIWLRRGDNGSFNEALFVAEALDTIFAVRAAPCATPVPGTGGGLALHG